MIMLAITNKDCDTLRMALSQVAAVAEAELKRIPYMETETRNYWKAHRDAARDILERIAT